MVRLVTWNCSQAFRRKKTQLLEAFDPDILVIQECEYPGEKGEWHEFTDWVWSGDDSSRGIGVFSRNGIQLTTGPDYDNTNATSIAAETDAALDVLGVWTKPDNENKGHRYISQVHTIIESYQDWLGESTIICGDFNWNASFSQSTFKPPLRHGFTDTVQLLKEYGYRSAYHAVMDCEFGDERESTYFARNRSWSGVNEETESLYHTNYVFVPERLVDSVTDVELGEKETWIYGWGGPSDHVPLGVEI